MIFALAGCIESEDSSNGHDPAISSGLEGPPAWQVGDWWTYRFTADMFNDYTEEVTIVVADVTDEYYLVGMPAEAYMDFAFAFHFPPMGEVRRDDLQWVIHDTWFQTIDFPLTNESTWEVDVVGFKGTAEVEVTGPTTASIIIEPFLSPIRAMYDAEVRHYTRIGVDAFGYADLIDHGTGYIGDILVPVDQKTIFYGRAAGAFSIDGSLAHLPSDDPDRPDDGINPFPVDLVEVPQRDWLSLVQWVGDFFLVPASSPGLFVERAEAPDGTLYEIMRTPADGEGVSMQHFGIGNPGGTWTFTHTAAGAGIATSEGIAHNRLAYTVGGE